MASRLSPEGWDGLLVPQAGAEAAVVEGVNVYPVGSLAEAVGFLSGQVDSTPSLSISQSCSPCIRTWTKTFLMSKARTTQARS